MAFGGGAFAGGNFAGGCVFASALGGVAAGGGGGALGASDWADAFGTVAAPLPGAAWLVLPLLVGAHVVS